LCSAVTLVTGLLVIGRSYPDIRIRITRNISTVESEQRRLFLVSASVRLRATLSVRLVRFFDRNVALHLISGTIQVVAARLLYADTRNKGFS